MDLVPKLIAVDWYPFDGAFLKRVSSRIVNEVEGVCRVLYDGRLCFTMTFELC